MMRIKRILITVAAALLCAACLTAPGSADGGEDVLRSDHSPYLNGYADGRFLPGRALSRAEGCAILYKLLATQERGGFSSEYTDVPDDAWYAEAVGVLASRGLLTGQGEAFRPEDPMTRGELAMLLSRLPGEAHTNAAPYSDVKADDPAAAAISAVSERGWLRGFEDGTFRPESPLTRGQAAAVFNRVLGRAADPEVLAADEVRRFPDVLPEDWFFGEVLEAAVEHINTAAQDSAEHWSGYSRTYGLSFVSGEMTTTLLVPEGETPKNVPTRAPDGKMIVSWLDESGKEVRVFDGPVSASATYYAVHAPELVREHIQYVRGYDDGSFRPDASVSRAQVSSIFYGLLADRGHGNLPVSLSDVSDGAWYAEAVKTLVSRGFLPAEDAFRPEDPITRGELAQLLSLLAAPVADAEPYADVEAGSTLSQAIHAVCAQGWMEPDAETCFRPGAPVSRAELVHSLNLALGRAADALSARQADSRYRFTDVPADHWAYADILEASTTHSYSTDEQGEHWSAYSHEIPAPLWEHSEPVTAAASILNTVDCFYHGTWDYNYNVDYADGLKEDYVNSKGYSSQTPYLLWISIQNQKIYLFTGEEGNWKYDRTFICATGLPGTPTPIGVSITYAHSYALLSDHYACYPVTFFAAGSGCGFHSRLHRPYGRPGWYDDVIGRPRSAGCVRMFDEDAQFIYDLPIYTTVVVY